MKSVKLQFRFLLPSFWVSTMSPMSFKPGNVSTKFYKLLHCSHFPIKYLFKVTISRDIFFLICPDDPEMLLKWVNILIHSKPTKHHFDCPTSVLKHW